jgi:hypothetical protein
MKNEPKLSRMPRVRQDMRRCRQFLRRKESGRATKRIAELMEGIRRLRVNPRLYPVRKVDAETGIEYRRHNVAQFVVIYSYFGPSPSRPHGEVSIRAITHASEGDIWFEVRERGCRAMQRSLSTRPSVHWSSPFSSAQKPARCTSA